MRLFTLAFISLLLSFTAFAQQEKDYDQLYQKLDKIRQEWKIPGMAIGIVHKDKLVFAEGFGVKNINNINDSVDSKTLFPIASNTKSFTSTAMAMLVKEGKVNWQDPVQKHLSYFQLYNPYVSKNFTIEDMLCHRSGLKTFSGDLLWYGSNYSREEVVRKAALLVPTTPFRTQFGYSNIMYIAAGEVIGQSYEKSWDAFIQDRIFFPLQMKHSYTSFKSIPPHANITSPHNHINKDVIAINYLNWDNIGGAGAIISNVEDMGQWLKFQLADGRWNNDTLISPRDITRMRTPHVNFPVAYNQKSPLASRHFYSYGLGWTLFDYLGVKVISHSGGYDGIISYSCFIPEKELAFVILTNANSGLYQTLLYTLLDSYLKEEQDVDWSAMMLPGELHGREQVQIERIESPTKLELKTMEYLGDYHCDLYGDVEVIKVNGVLYLQMKQTELFLGKLTHYDKNTFIIKMDLVPALPEGLVKFIVTDDKVQSLGINIENPDFHFDEFNFIKK